MTAKFETCNEATLSVLVRELSNEEYLSVFGDDDLLFVDPMFDSGMTKAGNA